MDTAEIIASLEQERDRLNTAIEALSGGRSRRGRRRMSAAAKKRISEAAKKRWAEWRKKR